MQNPESERNYPVLREQVEAAYDQIADRYAATTLSNEMLAQARMRVRGEVVQMDMCQLTFPAASFEGIWCCASFFHIPKAQATTALSQMQRVLIPEGMLYLSLLEGQDETWEEESRFCWSRALFCSLYISRV